MDLGHLNVSSTLLNFDKYIFLDKYLNEFGERVLEVHISENEGFKDQHLALKPNSWQLDVVREIKNIKVMNNKQRHFCLESRNATIEEIKVSINSINEMLSTY